MALHWGIQYLSGDSTHTHSRPRLLTWRGGERERGEEQEGGQDRTAERNTEADCHGAGEEGRGEKRD